MCTPVLLACARVDTATCLFGLRDNDGSYTNSEAFSCAELAHTIFEAISGDQQDSEEYDAVANAKGCPPEGMSSSFTSHLLRLHLFNAAPDTL